MEDILIIYQATLLVIKNFLPAAIFVVFGLAYIYFTEKKDKHKKSYNISNNFHGGLYQYLEESEE